MPSLLEEDSPKLQKDRAVIVAASNCQMKQTISTVLKVKIDQDICMDSTMALWRRNLCEW